MRTPFVGFAGRVRRKYADKAQTTTNTTMTLIVLTMAPRSSR